MIDDGGNPPDGLVVFISQERFNFSVVIKRMVLEIQQLFLAVPYRWDPIGIASVVIPGELHERFLMFAPVNRNNFDRI